GYLSANRGYVTGSTSGLLILDDGINLSNFIETFEDDVNKIRSEVWNWLIDALSEVGETLTSLIPNAKPVKLPSLNINLDRRNLHPDPRIRFRFSIHGLEIYIALEAKISVQETITVHLFTSETPLGVSLTGGEIGAVFAVDLILVADAEVEIGTGLHLMLDDNLGQGNLRALLRLQIRTGFRVGFDNLVSAGMESSISAYLVDLTISGNGSSDADEDCYLGGFAAYTLGLGAAAGASVAYGDAVWGPTPETTVPIFHASTTTCFDRMANTPNSQSPTLTGLSSTSPASASAETTSLSSSAKRGMDNGIMDQERGVVDSHIAGRMTSAEATTTVDAAPLLSYGKPQTLVVCKSKGLVECPHQLQSTATAPPIRAKTAPSAPPSGSSFTAFRKGFSRNVQTIEASSGAPVSYTPPPPPPTTTTSASSGTSVSHTAPSSATSTGASPKGGGNTHVAVIAAEDAPTRQRPCVVRLTGSFTPSITRCTASPFDLCPRHRAPVGAMDAIASLVGQSIISYLQKKGYPEIALQFVQDSQTRFELALECGNIDVAVEMARELDRPRLWTRLAAAALEHGNHQTVEMANQKLRNFDKLSFLYLATGDQEKLSRMAKIADHRGDFTSQFQNALYLGDVETRIQMFKEIGLLPLAYLTAKSHGLEDEAESIREAAGLTEDQISLPSVGKPIPRPAVIAPTYTVNWPVKAASHSSFEKVLLGEISTEEPEVAGEVEAEDEEETASQDLLGQEDEDEDVAGWDLGDDINVEEDDNVADASVPEAGPGASEADLWPRNSPLAADHVAAGSFETAMQLLNRQVGAVNFEPLKPRFMEIYKASKTYLPATPGLPPLVNYVRRTIDETDPRRILPAIPHDLETIINVDLQEGYTAMRANKLEDGVAIFRRVLHTLLVNVITSPDEADKVDHIIDTAREYILAMSIELERRALGTETPEKLKRSLELAAYFTVPKLEMAHKQLALMAAMKFHFSNKNYSSALNFANQMINNGGSAKLMEQAKKVKAQCERNPQDRVEIEFDHFADFKLCAASHTPIYANQPSVTDPYTLASYHEKYRGSVDRIANVTEIGAPASGLRLWVPGQ
ncbi:hypothetical protein KEM56_002858, partial [Ascosphaera pollenicola]